MASGHLAPGLFMARFDSQPEEESSRLPREEEGPALKLLINLKTANLLVLKIAEPLLTRADEVIR